MKAQHTPGPWFLIDVYNIHKNGDSSDTHICEMPPTSADPEAAANAALIAAAPDMLEALEMVLEADGDLYAIDFNQIRAAIAKAKGL